MPAAQDRLKALQKGSQEPHNFHHHPIQPVRPSLQPGSREHLSRKQGLRRPRCLQKGKKKKANLQHLPCPSPVYCLPASTSHAILSDTVRARGPCAKVGHSASSNAGPHSTIIHRPEALEKGSQEPHDFQLAPTLPVWPRRRDHLPQRMGLLRARHLHKNKATLQHKRPCPSHRFPSTRPKILLFTILSFLDTVIGTF